MTGERLKTLRCKLIEKDFLLKELVYYNLAVFHFIKHYLIDWPFLRTRDSLNPKLSTKLKCAPSIATLSWLSCWLVYNHLAFVVWFVHAQSNRTKDLLL